MHVGILLLLSVSLTLHFLKNYNLRYLHSLALQYFHCPLCYTIRKSYCILDYVYVHAVQLETSV